MYYNKFTWILVFINIVASRFFSIYRLKAGTYLTIKLHREFLLEDHVDTKLSASNRSQV